MTDINDFYPTDDVDDVLDDWIRGLQGGVLKSEISNTDTITATFELADSDCQNQIITPGTSNQTIELPPEAEATNHFFFIKNPTGSTYDLLVKDDSGSTTHCTLDAGEWAWCVPAGGVWHVIYSGTLSSSFVNTGWIEVADTWTYASASTITVPTDATTTYQKWMRVRFKQGGSYKYYVLTAVASTTLTVAVNTDYTVANSAITDIAYSPIDKPYGFPDEFNFSPSWTNLTVGSGTVTAKLKVSSIGVIKGHVEVVFNSTTIGGSVSIALPVPLGTYGGTPRFLSGNAVMIDAGTATYQGVTFVESSIEVYVSYAASTYVGRTPLSSTVPHTWANTDEMSFNFEYFG